MYSFLCVVNQCTSLGFGLGAGTAQNNTNWTCAIWKPTCATKGNLQFNVQALAGYE